MIIRHKGENSENINIRRSKAVQITIELGESNRANAWFYNESEVTIRLPVIRPDADSDATASCDHKGIAEAGAG